MTSVVVAEMVRSLAFERLAPAPRSAVVLSFTMLTETEAPKPVSGPALSRVRVSVPLAAVSVMAVPFFASSAVLASLRCVESGLMIT